MIDFYEGTKVGLSYSRHIDHLSPDQKSCFDYIEIPFELLNHDRDALKRVSDKPVILHCASLSLGGYTPPRESIKESIRHFVEVTGTPWIGEHIAYILADKICDLNCEPYALDEPYNIGYTVSPVMNSHAVDNIIKNIVQNEAYFKVPIVVENSPLYFSVPANEMSQTEFISEICKNSDTRLLLDLTHLLISSKNFSYNPKKELLKLPLDRVVEVHISGMAYDSSVYWDNHATRAPDIIFELLEILVGNVTPKAITFEYNWSPISSWDYFQNELVRVRKILNSN